MVVEQVALDVVEGKVEALLAYVATHRRAIDNSVGCRSFVYGRGVESPTKVFFLATWDSLEVHVAATKTAEFQAFSGGLREFVAGASVQHLDVAG